MKPFLVICVSALAAAASAHAAQEKKAAVANSKTEYLLSGPRGNAAASSRNFQQRLRQRFISMPQPKYPYEARRHWREGRGYYRIVVDATGKVTAVEVVVSAGDRVFDDEVKAAFRRWHAKPGSRLVVELPVTFVLDRTGRNSTESRIPPSYKGKPIWTH